MKENFILMNNITFGYDDSPNPILTNVTGRFTKGFTGITGANGCGKTTLLKLIAGILKPTKGNISIRGKVYYCDQLTNNVPFGFEDLITSSEKRAFRIKKMLQLNDEWLYRFNTLSFGERKRCQIASALFEEPDILAIDEPTNHLDEYAKSILLNALKSFYGVGLLISHDRQFLDELCSHIVIIEKDNFLIRRGNYSLVTEELSRENEHNKNMFEVRKKEAAKIEKEVNLHKQKASYADKLRSKSRIDSGNSDAKAKIDLARVTGKDAMEGKIYNRLKARLEKKEREMNSYTYKKSFTAGISFEKGGSKKKDIYFCAEGVINLGENVRLTYPQLIIRKGERIGLTGLNGSGKSSLIKHIANSIDTNSDSIVYIKQEISKEESSEIIDEIINSKNEAKGRMITIVSRLGSDSKKILETPVPSPGEVRKLLLAKGILKNPDLIIMDEPTNHMDLHSIKCVEEALQNANCAMLLVSHDKVFLDNLVETYWRITSDDWNSYTLRIC